MNAPAAQAFICTLSFILYTCAPAARAFICTLYFIRAPLPHRHRPDRAPRAHRIQPGLFPVSTVAEPSISKVLLAPRAPRSTFHLRYLVNGHATPQSIKYNVQALCRRRTYLLDCHAHCRYALQEDGGLMQMSGLDQSEPQECFSI